MSAGGNMAIRWANRFLLGLVVLGGMAPGAALACSVCYGEPESPASKGLSWAITALALIVVCVLAGAIAFFVQANRKATLLQASESATSVVGRD